MSTDAPPRLRRLFWAGVGGLVVLTVGATLAVESARSTETPGSVVRAYFAALARGDAGAALALGDLPPGGRALLSDAVLRRSRAESSVGSLAVGAATVRGDTATVPVRYTASGPALARGDADAAVSDVVALRRAPAGWRLTRTALPVRLDVASAAEWAQVPADPPFAVPGDVQLVFPGPLPIAYRTRALTLAPSSRALRFADVPLAGDDVVTVDAAVTAQAAGSITAAVNGALAACVVGGDGTDPFCPQPAPGTAADGSALRAVPQSFHGTVEPVSAADLTLTPGADQVGSITVGGAVPADGTWQALSFDNVVEPHEGPIRLGLGATVPVAALDRVVWPRTTTS